MECVELAPAVGCVARFESGSKLHAIHTLRAVWFRLCRPGDRRALPAGATAYGQPSQVQRIGKASFQLSEVGYLNKPVIHPHVIRQQKNCSGTEPTAISSSLKV